MRILFDINYFIIIILKLKYINVTNNKNEINQLYESNIILRNEIDLLKNWLPKEPTKIIKLYDSYKDSHNAGSFHRKCDNKGNTIVLVKTDSDFRFGGYTEKSWGSSTGDYICDTSAFIFSFNTKKKYLVDTPKYAIYCHFQYGPTFGNGHDIHISNYAPQNQNSYSTGMAYPLEEINILNGGNKNFTANYEVYQIIYP